VGEGTVREEGQAGVNTHKTTGWACCCMSCPPTPPPPHLNTSFLFCYNVVSGTFVVLWMRKQRRAGFRAVMVEVQQPTGATSDKAAGATGRTKRPRAGGWVSPATTEAGGSSSRPQTSSIDDPTAGAAAAAAAAAAERTAAAQGGGEGLVGGVTGGDLVSPTAVTLVTGPSMRRGGRASR
jgi:hypothetical protein